MNLFKEFNTWCQVTYLQFRTNIRKEKSKDIIGPCLTPETVPKFAIPDSVHQTLAQTSEEKNLCGYEELVLNAGFPFHILETKVKTTIDCLSKLELVKQNQFQACMISRKANDRNPSSIYEVCDYNDADYGKYTLKTCPQSASFTEIEDIPSVYFGQMDQGKIRSFSRKYVTEPNMSPPQKTFIVKNHAPLVSVNGREADPLPRRQSSSPSAQHTRRRYSLPYVASMSQCDKSDIREESISVCQSDGESVDKGKRNSSQETTGPTLSRSSKTPHCTQSIGQKLRAQLGELKIEFAYLENRKQLKVLLLRGETVGGYKKSDYNMNVYMRLCLMPGKLQTQFSTEQRHTKDPHYNEEFYFSNIKLRDVQEMTLQLKIYTNIPLRHTEKVDEISVPLFKYDILKETRLWMKIKNTTNKMYDIGHISLGVNLNTSHKELLVTGFGIAGRSDGTYVAVDVSQHFGDVTHQRTRDQQTSSYPVFNESLTFDLPLVALEDLMTTSIIVSVFKIELLGHDIMLGQVCLGCDSTEDSEKLHWQEALQSQGQTVGKWHYLME